MGAEFEERRGYEMCSAPVNDTQRRAAAGIVMIADVPERVVGGDMGGLWLRNALATSVVAARSDAKTPAGYR